ncbi:MAG TPA: FkbM family methyltransferase [Rhodocyclaceae bacterium]|nr:FkbM family methyltransferase [Rhodocyclaceae bacterium]
MIDNIKKAASKFAESQGYTVIPTWRLNSYPQASYLQKLFALLEIDCVFDVGANNGQFRDFLRYEVDYQGTIISFEAMPDYVERLRDRARQDEHWLIEGYALGSKSGTASFNVMAESQFSSFLQPDHSAVQRFQDTNTVQRTVEVRVKTLAEVMPELKRKFEMHSAYLKMDTQGFDLEVVRGAGPHIRDFLALQTEASVKPIYAGMPSYDVVIKTLEAEGFEPSGIFPNNSGHFPLLIEFDCHMISSSRVPKSAK